MFKEEEGVVAGFCSGFCRACGLALNDMAAGGEWEEADEKECEGCIEVCGRKSGRPSW
jgi:hypothetical protein